MTTLNNFEQDAQYSCQICFLSDLDHFNPIVFCGTCSLGAHQKCQGIADLDQDYNCDRCLEYLQKIRKNR